MSAITGRLLGIDHGLARIGVAVSDATGLVVRELAVIQRRSKAEDFAQLRRYAADYQVVALVVGVPINDHGGDYSQADKVRNWIGHLRAALPLPVIEWDETLTSADALELARAQHRRSTEPIDDLAARVILQSYLDAVRDGLTKFNLTMSDDRVS